MMRKGIGPRPRENAATKDKLAVTETRRQPYTMPRPKKRLEIPILHILHNKRGFLPLRSIRDADGSVVAKLTRDIINEIKADEEGMMASRIEVE